MDGMHDLGGAEGFGPIDRSHEGQPFHAAWEGRMFAMAAAMARPADWTIDWFRYARECARPVDYMTLGYFDQWAKAYETLWVDCGLLTIGELEAGKSLRPAQPLAPPLRAEDIRGKAHHPPNPLRPDAAEPVFAAGAAVRCKISGHSGHTRLPRYARGKPGVIQAYYGPQLLPDAAAAGEERAEPLYSVLFKARHLWPEATASEDEVCLDLWESYLEPV